MVGPVTRSPAYIIRPCEAVCPEKSQMKGFRRCSNRETAMSSVLQGGDQNSGSADGFHPLYVRQTQHFRFRQSIRFYKSLFVQGLWRWWFRALRAHIGTGAFRRRCRGYNARAAPFNSPQLYVATDIRAAKKLSRFTISSHPARPARGGGRPRSRGRSAGFQRATLWC